MLRAFTHPVERRIVTIADPNLTIFKLEPTTHNVSQQRGQTRETQCCAWQYCDMLHWNVAIVWLRLNKPFALASDHKGWGVCDHNGLGLEFRVTLCRGTYQIRKTVSNYISKKLNLDFQSRGSVGSLSKQGEESYEFKVFEQCGQPLCEESS